MPSEAKRVAFRDEEDITVEVLCEKKIKSNSSKAEPKQHTSTHNKQRLFVFNSFISFNISAVVDLAGVSTVNTCCLSGSASDSLPIVYLKFDAMEYDVFVVMVFLFRLFDSVSD